MSSSRVSKSRTDAAPAWEPAPVRPFDRLDLYIALGVFVVSMLTAMLYLPTFRASGGRGEFYQTEFSAAVMSACGQGYSSPATAPRSLTAFLDRQTDTFDCKDLPANTPHAGLSVMQGAFRYLMMSAALVWRVTGVKWNAIDIVLATLFASGLTAGYVALRFIAGRTLSIAGTLLWLSSPMHLGNLPHLRDYSKAPFFVLTLVAMAFVIRERRPWALAVAGAAFGVIQGIGFGMRTDVILNLAPFLLALFAAGPRGLRNQLAPKIVSAVLACALFTLVAWPILTAYGESEGVSHVAILGLTTPFDERLGIREAPYDFGAFYNDTFASAEVRGDWQRAHAGTPEAAVVPYARASRDYYIRLATTAPGDFLTRMAGSVMQTLNLPFSVTYGFVPAGITGRVLTTLGSWRTKLMLQFIGSGLLVALAILVIVGISRLRDALVGFALLVFWTAYPFIQFHGRHTFHLEFLVFAGFAGLLSLIGRSAMQIRRGGWPPFRRVAQSTGLVLAMLAASIVVIASARGVQAMTMARLLGQYERAGSDPVTSPVTLFEPPGPTQRVQQAMVVVDVAGTGCAKSPDAITFRYPPDRDGDFTRTVPVPIKPVRVFAPVYAMDVPPRASVRFTGVEVAPDGAGCVRVSRVQGVDQLLWLDTRLTPGWRNGPLHQRLYLGLALPERLWLKLAHKWPAISTLG